MNAPERVETELFEMVSDIEPVSFQRELRSVLADASLTPAVLTVYTAQAIDPSIDVAAAARRGAAVQLSYEGLRLTRRLAREEPWTTDSDNAEHHVDLLVSEVLVARGLYHLAPTGVAGRTVEIARRFGRNHTNEHLPDATPTEPSLEVDVIILAIDAGADLAMESVPEPLLEYADTLARRLESDPLPAHETALAGVDEDIDSVLAAQAVSRGDN